MRIGVVVPPWHYWIDSIKLQPLWELYYATLLADAFPDADVDVIDRRGMDDLQAPLPERDVYVYWVMKSADAFEVYGLVRRTRAERPTARHIAGGTHVDHVADQSADVFDAILQGTAEDTMVQAVADAGGGGLHNRYAANRPVPFVDFAHPRRDFIPATRVVNDKHFQMYGGVPGTGAYFSRGCGFKCRFCVYNNPPRFEYRTGDQITAEIEYLKRDYGVEGINLRDEVCIPVNRRQAVEYLEAIGRCGVIWRGQTVPLGSEDMVRLAAESGLKEAALGLESVDSDLVITIADKPSKSIEANRRYIELLQKYGIRVKVCLIFGLPGESRHVLDRTVRFLEDVAPDYVAVSGFDPVPGSRFHLEPGKYGIKSIDEDLSKHAHLMHRFGDEEEVGLPFEYETETPWGPSLSRAEISENIKTIQGWLRERGMSY